MLRGSVFLCAVLVSFQQQVPITCVCLPQRGNVKISALLGTSCDPTQKIVVVVSKVNETLMNNNGTLRFGAVCMRQCCNTASVSLFVSICACAVPRYSLRSLNTVRQDQKFGTSLPIVASLCKVTQFRAGNVFTNQGIKRTVQQVAFSSEQSLRVRCKL